MRRSVGVVTGSRSEYGLLRPLLYLIGQDTQLKLRLYVTGSHLSPLFGLTVQEIEKDDLPIAERIPILGSAMSSANDAAQAFAKAVLGFSKTFTRNKPDILVLMSDRYEMLAAAVAAMFHKVVIAHISGGKTTQGSMDEYVRHAITKMSHYHFTHTQDHRRRIILMGEHPSRVFAFGSPVLDEIVRLPDLSLEQTKRLAGLEGHERYVMVLYHPETLDARPAQDQMDEVLEAVKDIPYQKIVFYPGADVGSEAVIQALEKFAVRRDVASFKTLPRLVFLNLLKHSLTLIGNSSCGITDTPTLGVPVVNIGDRQKGMVKARNVVDCPCLAQDIRSAIKRTLSPSFKRSLRGIRNPYGDGKSSQKIFRKLRELSIGPGVLKKVFYDNSLPL